MVETVCMHTAILNCHLYQDHLHSIELVVLRGKVTAKNSKVPPAYAGKKKKSTQQDRPCLAEILHSNICSNVQCLLIVMWTEAETGKKKWVLTISTLKRRLSSAFQLFSTI